MSSTFSSSSISIQSCQKMGDAAIAKAKEIGITIALTIVDGGGNPKYFIRMDNAPLIATDISRKKAVTAVGFGMPTGEAWHNLLKMTQF